MKFKKFFAAVSAAVMMGMCSLNNIYMVKAESDTDYAMGDLDVSESERDAFMSQFDSYDSEVDWGDDVDLGEKWDLTDPKIDPNAKYFPPIGNQGKIGSCTAWATTYYQFTYAANKLNDITTTSSNAYSPTWTYNYTNYGVDKGSSYQNAYNVLMHQGAVTLSDIPYVGIKEEYDYSWLTDTGKMMNALNTRISSVKEESISSTGTVITSNNDSDLNIIKYRLKTGHTLLVRVRSMSNWSYENRYGENTSDIVAYRAANGNGGHAMTVVGYDDTVCCDVNGNGTIEECEKGAFKVANSWGTNWGNGGYIWVLYDALNEVSANTVNNWEASESGTRISIFNRRDNDVDQDNIFRYIEVENYDVNLAGLLTINTDYRNKLTIDLFRNNTSSTDYTNSLSYLSLNKENVYYNNGSEKIYCRNVNAPFNGSVVFDYGEYDDPTSICTNGYYYGVDINNMSSNNAASFTNVSYKIIDNKFNVVKELSDISKTIANGSNSKKNAKIRCQKGDVDYDGSVSVADGNIIMNHVAMTSNLSNLQYYLADYNNDGNVNISDVVAIQNTILNTSSRSRSITLQNEMDELNRRIEEYYASMNGVEE